MKYGLYSEAKNSPVVKEKIDDAIFTFVLTLKDISKKYRGTGMTDTSAKECIGEAVTEAMFEEL